MSGTLPTSQVEVRLITGSKMTAVTVVSRVVSNSHSLSDVIIAVTADSCSVPGEHHFNLTFYLIYSYQSVSQPTNQLVNHSRFYKWTK